MKQWILSFGFIFASLTLVNAQVSKPETFSFPVLGGRMTLSGTLAFPAEFSHSTPLAILVSPPQPSSENYGGLFKALSDTLTQQGVAVYRYNNRNFTDSANNARNPERFTMFDAAADAHDAFLALKNDGRFKNNPIGMLGHSEGGSTTTIEASQNKDLDFLILLSTIGISGEAVGFKQMNASIARPLRAMPVDDRNSLVRQLYFLNKISAESKNDDETKVKLEEFIRKDYKENPKQYGKMTEDKSVETLMNVYYQPRRLAFARFKPELYYSKIMCPVFASHGMMDNLLECSENLEGIERIFIENEKKNYTILPIDSVDHSYKQVKKMETHEQSLYKAPPFLEV